MTSDPPTHADVKLSEFMGEIGYMKSGLFHRRTNFSVTVVGHVMKSDGGDDSDSDDQEDDNRQSHTVLEYLVKIKKSDDHSTR